MKISIFVKKTFSEKNITMVKMAMFESFLNVGVSSAEVA